jgi:2-keto-4-pentenoate hydratase/2-oxohepta-3-ene-1,7-dioic acid hydratase in catechol pathway
MHAKELNNPVPEKPVFFMKPETALLLKNRPFFHPDFSNDIHYEVELVFRINKVGKHIQEKFAHTYYDKVAIGIDLTARDVQAECKAKGLPWEPAKAFDSSAPLSEFIPVSDFDSVHEINFSLNKNGVQVQSGNSKDMLFNIDRIIAYVSQFVTLKIGDLIYTGTPAGVGKIAIGDEFEAFIEGKSMLKMRVK